jgi:GNAT superfamily N-acetyltransferase
MTKTAEPGIVRLLSADAARGHIAALSSILMDCVEGGASVSFMTPLTREKADGFWLGVAASVAAGDRVLLVAEDRSGGELVGTVQVVLGMPENQPHRAEIAKMLVHRSARRKGVGAILMRAAEETARELGRTLLVLDTVTGGDGERLYERLGWSRVGVVPDFALMPDGQPCATTIFYKRLPESPPYRTTASLLVG